MTLKEVCRACLCTGQTMYPLLKSILPKFDSPPNSVVDLCKIFSKMLVTHKNRFPDKICADCLHEIQKMYSFMRKCDRADDTLKKMKNIKLYLKKLKIVSVLPAHKSLLNINSEYDMHLDVSQIKTENIEESENHESMDLDCEDFPNYIHADDNQIDPRLQCPPLQQLEDDHKKQDQPGCESDVRKDHVLFIQDIKEEPALEISTANNECDGIESQGESSSEILKCSDCNYECNVLESLAKHLIEKHMEGSMCKICNKEFKFPAIKHCFIHLDAIQGITKSRTDIRRFKCKICLKLFRVRHDLKRHLSTHKDDIPYKCKICSKTFQLKRNLTIHLKCHKEQPYKCKICHQDYETKNYLADHLKWHAIDKPFKCENCPKSFQNRISLTEHSRYHHNGEQPFKCAVCKKAFQRKSNLTKHLRCHSEVQLFKCEICPKDYLQEGSLKKHLKLHKAK